MVDKAQRYANIYQQQDKGAPARESTSAPSNGAALGTNEPPATGSAPDDSIQMFPFGSNRVHPSPDPRSRPKAAIRKPQAPLAVVVAAPASEPDSSRVSFSSSTTETAQLLPHTQSPGSDRGSAEATRVFSAAPSMPAGELLTERNAAPERTRTRTESVFLSQNTSGSVVLSGKKRRQSVKAVTGLRANRKTFKQLLVPVIEVISKSFDRAFPVISPVGRKRRYWDIVIIFMVMYNAILVPYDAAFTPDDATSMVALGYVIDMLFAFDLLLNFRTAYVNLHGHMIRDGGDVATHYLRTYFFMDLFASIPFELLAPLFTGNSGHLKLLAFLKTPRLLRLGRLMRIFERMRNANVIRILRLTMMMCLFGHWAACGWQLLATFLPSHEWALEADASRGYRYVVVLYYSFQLMVGNGVEGNSTAERIYESIVLLLGACFYAVVVGNMAVLVSNLNAAAARHRKRQDMVVHSARYLALPAKIQERIQEYFEHLITYSHPGREGWKLLQKLPPSIYMDIVNHITLEPLRQVPMLAECEAAFLAQMAVRLRSEVFCVGETIFRAGDVGHDMYLISKGQIAVVNSHGELVTILEKGAFFGDLALVGPTVRQATCVCLTHCDVQMLNNTALHIGMKDFPVSAEAIKRHMKRRMADGPGGKATDAAGKSRVSPELNTRGSSRRVLMTSVPVDTMRDPMPNRSTPTTPGAPPASTADANSASSPTAASATSRRAMFRAKSNLGRVSMRDYDFRNALAKELEYDVPAAEPNVPAVAKAEDGASVDANTTSTLVNMMRMLQAMQASQEAMAARINGIDSRLTRMDLEAPVDWMDGL